MYKITHRVSWLLTLAVVFVVWGGIVSVLVSSPVAASSESSGAITQSYSADPTVQVGMLVASSPKDSSTVIPLRNNQLKLFLGIVIPTGNAALVLTPEQTVHQQVLVARSGSYDLLVSDQNGAIKANDYLTISALGGIAMKAGTDQQQIIGRAAADFTGNTDVLSEAELKDKGGHTTSVHIGRMAADINISSNPLFQKSVNYVPGILAKVAVSIANKQVSVGRIYLGAAILILISVITGSMLYSGIRNGMRAIGRNPLSKKSILRGLLQTMLAALIIFGAGIFAVYLLLKL